MHRTGFKVTLEALRCRYDPFGLVLICGVEAALTRYAPRLFPNPLNETRSPVDDVETIANEFNRLDTQIDTAVRGWE